ncbi:hypothetical protein LTR15_010162 [Elasticomyces elasticus]|nr:hypothetical protein LTR15_010162 [Elasticomyces elasticus]
MAIHPRVPGLTVTISVNNKDLPEIDDPDVDQGDPINCAKYIEAPSGAEFGIAIHFDPTIFPYPDDHVRCSYEVDGTEGAEVSFRPSNIMKGVRTVYKGALRNTKDGLAEHAMLFSELTINKDDEGPDQSLLGKLKEIGTITIRCYRVEAKQVRKRPARNAYAPKPKVAKKAAAPLPATAPQPSPTPLIPTGQVSEKTLKCQAVSHQAM